MEAVPKLPMLWIDMKASPEGTSFAKLKKYIAECYQEDPESYNKEVFALETLRNTSMRPDKSMEGCATLKRYYCQLFSITKRFPKVVGKNLFKFYWKDMYQNSVHEYKDIYVEMAIVLFNISALHTQVGSVIVRTDIDGMKLACTHFQCAAWGFTELMDKYTNVLSKCDVDFMTQELLIFMQQVAYAQAQECILEKSLIDNRKPNIVAKVTAQIIIYYNTALSALISAQDKGRKGFVRIIPITEGNAYKMWKKYVQFKIAYLQCILYLYQGQQSEDMKKMGERFTYYQAACDKLEECQKESKGLFEQKPIEEFILFMQDVVAGKRDNAKKENEFIYHESIPELNSLSAVQGANLVNGIPFSATDPEVAGEDIFGRLIPMEAHEASSLYSEEKAQLLRKFGTLIEDKNSELTKYMSSLTLDNLNISEERANKIPQGIVDRCASLNAKSNAIPDLIVSMSSLADICAEVEMNLKEIKEMLTEEDAKEKQYQQSSGERHRTNTHLTELSREFQKYSEAHQKAGESNDTLRRAMELHVNNLKILSRPLHEIQSNVPKLSEQLNENMFKDLKLILNKVNEMRAQREKFHADLRISVNNDDITSKVIGTDKEDGKLQELFQTELSKHEKICNLIEHNLSAQANVLAALTESYAKTAPLLKTLSDVKHKKENFYSSLASSYDVYEDLLGKSGKGLEFYKKLQGNVQKLLTRVRAARDVQSEDRQLRIKSLEATTAVASSPSTTSTVVSSDFKPKLKDYLNKSSTPYIPSIRPNPLGSENPSAVSTASCYNVAAAPNEPPPPYTPPSIGSHNQYYSSGYTNPIYQGQYNQYPQAGEQMVITQSFNQTSNSVQDQHYSTFQQNVSQAPAAITTNQQNMQSFPTQQQFTSESYFQHQIAGYQNQNVDANAQLSTTYPSSNVFPPQQQFIANNQFQQTGNYSQQNVGDFSTQQQLPMFQQPIAVEPQISSYQQPHYEKEKRISNITDQQTTAYSQGNTIQQTNSLQQPFDINQQQFIGYQQPVQCLSNDEGVQLACYQQTNNLNISLAANTSFQQPSQNQYMQTSEPEPNIHQQQFTLCNQKNMDFQKLSGEEQQIKSHVPSNIQPYQKPDEQQPHNQSFSYSSHPGYIFNTFTGNYDYTSGYQTEVSNPYYSHANKSSDNPPMTHSSQAVNQNNQMSATTTGNYINSSPTAYYSVQYGQQHTGNEQIVQNVRDNVAGSPMTYVQSGYNSNMQTVISTGNTDSTCSGHSAKSEGKPVHDPKKNTIKLKKTATNVDLLSDIDFNGGTVPLQPAITPVKLDSPAASRVSLPAIDKKEQSFIDEAKGESVETTTPLPTPFAPIIVNSPQITERKSSIDNISLSSDLSSNFDWDSVSVAGEKPQIQPSPSLLSTSQQNSLLISTLNPFSDPKNVKFFHKEVERYEKIIEGLNIKMLNGMTPLMNKWKELNETNAKDENKRTAAISKLFPEKNRSNDCIPYDHARVVLERSTDDYINAAYVRNLGLGGSPPVFILAQTPQSNTVNDFWSMIWSQKSRTVVCLHTPNEIFDTFWPQECNKEMTFDDFSVTLVRQLEMTNCNELKFKLSMHGADAILDLSFLQIKSWIKNSPSNIVGIAKDIISVYKERCSEFKCNFPLIMNCLTCSERSGVVAVAICAILATQMKRPMLINVVDVWIRICAERKNAIKDISVLELSMNIVLSHAHDLLNKHGILTSYQMKIAQTTNVKDKEEFQDPLNDLDPLWKLK